MMELANLTDSEKGVRATIHTLLHEHGLKLALQAHQMTAAVSGAVKLPTAHIPDERLMNHHVYKTAVNHVNFIFTGQKILQTLKVTSVEFRSTYGDETKEKFVPWPCLYVEFVTNFKTKRVKKDLIQLSPYTMEEALVEWACTHAGLILRMNVKPNPNVDMSKDLWIAAQPAFETLTTPVYDQVRQIIDREYIRQKEKIEKLICEDTAQRIENSLDDIRDTLKQNPLITLEDVIRTWNEVAVSKVMDS